MEIRKLVIPNEVLLGQVADLVASGTNVTLLARGNSMLPFIIGDKDSVLLIKPTPLKKGQIVLAEVVKGHYVLHRIIKIEGENITLMGDGNLCGTEHCKVSDVKALAIKVLKGEREIDCYTGWKMFEVRLWHLLLPIRRYLLAIYRRIVL